jgi:hypothetical protein
MKCQKAKSESIKAKGESKKDLKVREKTKIKAQQKS